MPINKPTISHQLKTVKTQKSKPTSIIHTIPNIVPFSPQNRSHLLSLNSQPKQSSYNRNVGNFIDGCNLSSNELKECTKLLRNVLCSDENKSTSTTDDFNLSKTLTSRSVAFKSPDLSSACDQESNSVKRSDFINGFDDRTDAESLTSIPDQTLGINLQNTRFNNPSTPSTNNRQPLLTSTPVVYCSCHFNNNFTMHDARPPPSSSDIHKNNEKMSICTRCHNIIPSFKSHPNDVATDKICNKSCNDDYNTSKLTDIQYHNINSSTIGHTDYKLHHQYNDSNGDKIDDFMTYLHIKINELQSIARVTRDADLGRIISEIERTFQQIFRENSLLSNHLKTINKTLKWENSAMKQKIKNQSESNRDMKSELKLIRQEQKQKIEELKLEVQLKGEEIRQLTEKDKSNIMQWRDKYHSLEKEHEKLRSEFQGQILQSCHKDTDIIQLKHSCSQTEAKLKDEIHSLTMSNQNLKQDLNACQVQCRKFEQELNHNQLIVKAAREHVVNLLDRHKQNRGDSSSFNYRFEPSCDASVSGEWIHQATNLQQVLSMAPDGRDKCNNNLSPSTNWSTNIYSNNPQQVPDQSMITNGSMNNFATTNFNNNYVSSSTYNPVLSDSTNPISNYDTIPFKTPIPYPTMGNRSQSPSNMSSTLSDHSFNTSLANNNDHLKSTKNLLVTESNSRRCSFSSDSDVNDDPWSLPQPSFFKKMSSGSSAMSTVSSMRSSDDIEFRKGLKRLDSQISRLQNTLQSNLQCK